MIFTIAKATGWSEEYILWLPLRRTLQYLHAAWISEGVITEWRSVTEEAVGGMAGKFAIAFAAIQAGIAAVKSAFSSLGEISSAAAAMEQTSLAFTVMMGDAATAAEYVAKLKKYAAETPFEFGDISGAAKTLLSMGTEAEKSIEVIIAPAIKEYCLDSTIN